jgi:hypothetical protein
MANTEDPATHLAHVLPLLSKAALLVLSADPPAVQVYVLQTIANAIAFWEAQGVTLDPVQLDTVLDSIVALARGHAEYIMGV